MLNNIEINIYKYNYNKLFNNNNNKWELDFLNKYKLYNIYKFYNIF